MSEQRSLFAAEWHGCPSRNPHLPPPNLPSSQWSRSQWAAWRALDRADEYDDGLPLRAATFLAHQPVGPQPNAMRGGEPEPMSALAPAAVEAAGYCPGCRERRAGCRCERESTEEAA